MIWGTVVFKMPSLSSNIFLVGPMGVGKSTIGRQLALIFDMNFRDSDKEIEERTGASISLIFEIEGEAGFRKREKSIVAELVEMSNLVLATGGGVVLDEENRLHLKANGHVIYLRASVDDLLIRTAHSCGRPLLKTDNPRQRLETIFQQREHLYQEVADAIVETGHFTVTQVVKKVVKQIKKLEKFKKQI